jgi:CheY-like chemotaxis protein
MNVIPASPLCVLVVDDCVDAANSMAMLVEAWGHCAAVAYNGAEALRLAAVCCPDVVLLDVGMPELSGWDVAVRLRQLPGLANVYLVVVSGYGQEADLAHSRCAGCDLHLTKPVLPRDLQRLLSSRQKEKQRHDPRTTDPIAERTGDGGGHR